MPGDGKMHIPADAAIMTVLFHGRDNRDAWARCVAALATPSSVFAFDNGGHEDYTSQSHGFTVLREGRNIGYCAAMNRLIGASRERGFRLALILNADAGIDADGARTLFETLEREKAAAVFPKVLRKTEPGVLDGAWAEVTWRHFAVRYAGEGAPDGPEWSVSKAVLCGHGCCYAADLDAISGEDGYDESFFAYQDETDLGLRLARAGRRVLYAPSAVAFHLGPQKEKARALKRYWLARNSVLLVRKHGGFAEKLRFAMWLAAASALRWGPRALSGNAEARSAMAGWRDGLLGRGPRSETD
jgi:GT2 family glycosyltransferase